MKDDRFDEHLPEELREVADALAAGRAVPDGHLLERVLRRVQKTPPRRRIWLRPRALAALGVLALLAFALKPMAHFSVTQAVNAALSSTGTTQSAAGQVYCPADSIAVRWHYVGIPVGQTSYTSGSWSGTGHVVCPADTTNFQQQAMEGDLHVAPGSTLKAGYDISIPGLPSGTTTVNVTNPQVTFTQVHCASGATPTSSTFTITMPNATYSITTTNWYPSGTQSSPLVFEGSITVPNLCSGGAVRLDQGGTFSATIT